MAWVTKDSDEQYAPPAEPQRAYTKQEKAANWWHYNKWIVLVVAAAVAFVVWILHDTLFRVEPDYQVAYVGAQSLPDEALTALETALTPYCDDRNGDGQVVVQVNAYTVDFANGTEGDSAADPYNQMAGVTQLSADLSGKNGSYIFLLEDPAGFEDYTEGLLYLDGTLPDTENGEAANWQQMVYRWTDCPVLAGLDLGEYTGYGDASFDNQSFFADVYVGRRGAWTEEAAENYADDETLWQALTEGAAPDGTEAAG